MLCKLSFIVKIDYDLDDAIFRFSNMKENGLTKNEHYNDSMIMPPFL